MKNPTQKELVYFSVELSLFLSDKTRTVTSAITWSISDTTILQMAIWYLSALLETGVRYFLDTLKACCSQVRTTFKVFNMMKNVEPGI